MSSRHPLQKEKKVAGQERVFQAEEIKHLKVLRQEGAWYKTEQTKDQHLECSKKDRTVEDKSRRTKRRPIIQGPDHFVH